MGGNSTCWMTVFSTRRSNSPRLQMFVRLDISCDRQKRTVANSGAMERNNVIAFYTAEVSEFLPMDIRRCYPNIARERKGRRYSDLNTGSAIPTASAGPPIDSSCLKTGLITVSQQLDAKQQMFNYRYRPVRRSSRTPCLMSLLRFDCARDVLRRSGLGSFAQKLSGHGGKACLLDRVSNSAGIDDQFIRNDRLPVIFDDEHGESIGQFPSGILRELKRAYRIRGRWLLTNGLCGLRSALRLLLRQRARAENIARAPSKVTLVLHFSCHPLF